MGSANLCTLQSACLLLRVDEICAAKSSAARQSAAPQAGGEE